MFFILLKIANIHIAVWVDLITETVLLIVGKHTLINLAVLVNSNTCISLLITHAMLLLLFNLTKIYTTIALNEFKTFAH
jgi:hypothetical protein